MRVAMRLAFTMALAACATSAHGQENPIGALRTTIGAAEAPEEEVFGEITDAVLSDDGILHVVDEMTGVIRSFTMGGEYLSSFGRRGRGPGEFLRPLSADLDAFGRVLVADADNRRVTILSWQDGALDLEATFQVDSYLIESCVLNESLIGFQFVEEGTLLSVLDADGEKMTGFAERELASGELAGIPGPNDHMLYSGTSLGCDSSVPAVVIARHRQPVLRSFSFQGEELWRVELEEFLEMGYGALPSSNQCCIASIPDRGSGTFETVWSVVPDGLGRLVVSVEEYHPETRERTYENRILSSKTGQELGRFTAPGIALLIRGDVVVSKSRSPIPRVYLHDWRPLDIRR